MVAAVGRHETDRLTAQTLGATPSHERVQQEIRGYLRRHWVLDKMCLAGLVHYGRRLPRFRQQAYPLPTSRS